MANYATLKAAISAAIKENGNNEITGTLLQQQLLAMVNSLGDNYQFVGIATPATNPGTPDQNVFYIAATVGTYSNMGGIVVTDGEVAVIKYNGSWSKETTGIAPEEQVQNIQNQKTDLTLFVIDGDINKSVNAYIKELFIVGLGSGNYVVRGLSFVNGVATFAIGDENGIIVQFNNVPANGKLQIVGNETYTLYAIFKDVGTLTETIISGNADLTKAKLNNVFVFDSKYSPTIQNYLDYINRDSLPRLQSENFVKGNGLYKVFGFSFEEGYRYTGTTSIGSTPVKSASSGWRSIRIPVKVGEKYGICGEGTVFRLWCTVGSNGKVVRNSEENATYTTTPYEITIASNEVELIVQSKSDASLVKYGYAEEYANFKRDTKEYEEGLNERLNIAVNDYVREVINASSQNAADGNFGNVTWVLINEPFTESGTLKSIHVGCITTDFPNMNLGICVGKFDTESLVLTNPRVFYIPISTEIAQKTDSNYAIQVDVSSFGIKVNAGEVIAIYSASTPDGNVFNTFIRKTGTNSTKIYTCTETAYFVPKHKFALAKEVYIFDCVVDSYVSDFGDKHVVDNNVKDIKDIQGQLVDANILIDRATGIPYMINVTNGVFGIKSLLYGSVVFMGTSYINMPATDSWNVEAPRSMAASFPETAFTSLVMDGIRKSNPDAIMSIINDGVWQNNYDNFNYESNFGNALDAANPDVIFIVTGGNSTFSSTFGSAFSEYLAYLKQKCPKAVIVPLVGWYTIQKRDAMISACLEQNVRYADVIDINELSMRWQNGDWYHGADGSGDGNTDGYYGFSSSTVTGLHANDIGFALAAERCLNVAHAKGISDKIHKISITKTGNGIITTPNTIWVQDGLVTLRIESGTLQSISVKDSSNNTIPTTERNNSYSGESKNYITFIMPNSDVTIEAAF